MKHYIDITLLPSDDIGLHFLWSKVMMQVHLALVEIQDSSKQVPVAVGFPGYKDKTAKSPAFIGNKIRLYATDVNDLERLNINKWFNRLDDYVHVKAINKVPDNIGQYISFNRVTKAGSADKHIRRRMKRHNESLEQAALFFEGYAMDKEIKALPFINMKSLGGGEQFNMIIRRIIVEPSTTMTTFSTYGFNRFAALPMF